MKQVEEIKALIREMMDREMENYKEAVSIGAGEASMSPGIYTMLQVLLAKIDQIPSVWHNASEEPDDMSHCLIFYGDNDFIGHYLHYEPVLYNKKVQEFVTAQRPHPTGYKVEQKSLDGACVAEVYKDRRDRFSISDIGKWCYLDDISPK